MFITSGTSQLSLIMRQKKIVKFLIAIFSTAILCITIVYAFEEEMVKGRNFRGFVETVGAAVSMLIGVFFILVNIFKDSRLVLDKPTGYSNQDEIDARLKRMEDILTTGEESNRQHLSDLVKEHVENIATESVIEKIENKVRAGVLFSELSADLTKSETNLVDLVNSNRFHIKMNAVFGAISAFASIYVAYSMVSVNSSTDTPTFLSLASHYFPWISLLVVLEIVVFFFLNLYKKNIDTERFVRNELTNVLAKRSALMAAFYHGDKDVIEKVISVYAGTERNNIISKDQTTVEIQRAKLDGEINQSAAEVLIKLLPWSEVMKSAVASKADGKTT